MFIPHDLFLRMKVPSFISSNILSADIMTEQMEITIKLGARTLLVNKKVRNNGIHSSSIHIRVAENAHLTYIYDQQIHQEHAQEITQISFEIDRDGIVNFVPLIKGGSYSILKTNLIMKGPGASAFIQGVCALQAHQQAVFVTEQLHYGPQTISNVHMHTVLSQNAQAYYHGLVMINAKAQQSDAQQTNKVLLLDKGARAVSIPSLEIKTNNVRCAHGSAIGQLDPEELFYVQSRGLDYEEAQKLLTNSFLFEPFSHNMNSYLESYVRSFL